MKNKRFVIESDRRTGRLIISDNTNIGEDCGIHSVEGYRPDSDRTKYSVDVVELYDLVDVINEFDTRLSVLEKINRIT